MDNLKKLISKVLSIKSKSEEYIFQTGFPASFKKKGVVLYKTPPTTYAWKFEDVKQLFEWLTSEDYIVRSIDVFEMENKIPKFQHQSWIYIGDRTQSFEDSKKSNREQSFAFIEEVYAKNSNALFEVFFESPKSWDLIRIEFFNRAIISGGEWAYMPKDSPDIIDRCRQLGTKITGFDAFIIRPGFIQPQDMMSYYPETYDKIDPAEYLMTYHIKKNTDVGHWEEAKQWIRDRADNGWVFEIDYEK
jgi:hypothetical protein